MYSYGTVTNKFLPVLRGSAANLLASKYGITQSQIAKILGVTQAEVSKYLNNPEKFDAIKYSIDPEGIDSFAKAIMKGDDYNSQRIMCKLCPKNTDKSCAIRIK